MKFKGYLCYFWMKMGFLRVLPVACALFVCFIVPELHAKKTREFDVLFRDSALYRAPQAETKSIRQIEEGTRVIVLRSGKPPGWSQVFDGKNKGWVLTSDLEVKGAAIDSSRIHGGDHYSYKDGWVNLRLNPLGLIVRLVSADLDFKIAEQFTLGTSFGYINYTVDATKLSALALALRSTWSFTNGVNKDGFYTSLAGGWTKINLEVDVSANLGAGSVGKASANSWFIGLMGGYHWFFKNGLNIYFGGGASYFATPSNVRLDVGSVAQVPGFRGFMPAGELSIGWVF